MKLALDEFHRGRRELSHYAILLGGEDRLQRARLHAIANAGQGQMGREGTGLLRVPETRHAIFHGRLKALQFRHVVVAPVQSEPDHARRARIREGDRKSTRLNSSHGYISYAVFCLKKKKKKTDTESTSLYSHYKV